MRNNRGTVGSTHFKRKKKQSTFNKGKLLVILLVVILVVLIKNLVKSEAKDYKYTEVVNDVADTTLKEATMKAEADITKSVLEVKASKAERFVSEINNEIEYITYQEDGKQSISHSRLGKNAGFFSKTFKGSKIKINFKYQAIFSIKTSDIMMYVADGKVNIEYDPNNIVVKSVEISDTTTKSSKSWFGKKYSNQETLSLIEIAKEQIYEQLSDNSKIKEKACENLNTYFTKVAKKLGVDELNINSESVIQNSYNFIDTGTVKYNHGTEPIEDIKYIVVHSTACKDISAEQFYENLNTHELKRKAIAHFYCDDKDIIQVLPTNIQSWNCGTKNPKIPCTNANSISIEICEFSDSNKQQKAIDNAAKFVKEVLAKEYPQAKIVKHRDISKTLCPNILTDEQFNEYFK